MTEEQLIDAIAQAFSGVAGPPKVTLSVAYGIDDHLYDQLPELAAQQAHHRHWRDVTDLEMRTYPSPWCFLDAEAFRFYLPAFMISTLVASRRAAPVLPPIWMRIGFMEPEDDRQIALMDHDQRSAFLAFLEFIADRIHPLDRNHFEEITVEPWRRLIVEQSPGHVR